MTQQDTITVRELVNKLLQMWKLILSVCIVVAVGAYFYKHFKDSSTFRAETNLIISPENKNVATRYGIYTLESVNIADYSDIIYHEDVINNTLAQFDLKNISTNKFKGYLSHSLSNYSGRKGLHVKFTSPMKKGDEILDAHITNTLRHLNAMYQPIMISFFENKLKEERYKVMHNVKDLENRMLITDSLLEGMEELSIKDYPELRNKNIIIDLNGIRNQNHIELQNELLHNKLEFYENKSTLEEIEIFLQELEDLKNGYSELYGSETDYLFNPFNGFIKTIKPSVLQVNYRFAGISPLVFTLYASIGTLITLIFLLSLYFMVRINNEK